MRRIRIPGDQPGRAPARSSSRMTGWRWPARGVIAEYLDETRGEALEGPALSAAGPGAADRGAPAARLVPGQVPRRGRRTILSPRRSTSASCRSERGGGAARHGRDSRGADQCALSSRYIGYLIARRNWLAGDQLTYADLAAAAHLSVVDYLGDVPWDEDEAAKHWYARIKSRPSFRAAARRPGAAACRRRRSTRTSTSERRRRSRRAVVERAGREASTPSASPRPMRSRAAAGRLAAWLEEGQHGVDGVDGENGGAPRRSAHALARGAQRHHARR